MHAGQPHDSDTNCNSQQFGYLYKVDGGLSSQLLIYITSFPCIYEESCVCRVDTLFEPLFTAFVLDALSAPIQNGHSSVSWRPSISVLVHHHLTSSATLVIQKLIPCNHINTGLRTLIPNFTASHLYFFHPSSECLETMPSYLTPQ